MNLTIENLLTLISLFFAMIGGIFIYLQWQKSLKIRRAEFISQIIEKLRFNDDLAKILYKVEYEPAWYNESFHKNDLEYTIDKLFSYLNYVCYLKFTRNIKEVEFNIFRYELNRVCVSESTKAYLWNLYHFSVKNYSECSFQYLINYGVNSKLFPADFKKNETLYTKILNF